MSGLTRWSVVLALLLCLCSALPLLAQEEAGGEEETTEEAASTGLKSWWLPEVVSAHGPDIDRLFTVIFVITGITFVLVELCLLLFLFRYRRRPGRRAVYTHGNNTLEIVWTIIPAVILVILGFVSRNVWAEIKGGLYDDVAADTGAYQVMVIPEQFQWNITYPGTDGKLGTPDDITTINQLHLPVNRNVVVRLRSKDVIHSFFLPEMRVKQDALPNAWARVRFKPVKKGSWEIQCAELCGLGHYRMRGFVVVESEQELSSWLATQAAEGS